MSDQFLIGKASCERLCNELRVLRSYFGVHGRSVQSYILVLVLFSACSKAQGRHALTALAWACLVTDCNEVIQKEIILSQTTFLAATAADPHLWRCALKRLQKFWSTHPTLSNLHCSILLTLEPSLPIVCMLAALCGKADVQAKILDAYCKVVLQSRTGIDMQLLVHDTVIYKWESWAYRLLFAGKMSFYFHLGYTRVIFNTTSATHT